MHTRRVVKSFYHPSHVTCADPATTRIRPGSNGRVPGSGTWRNSLPDPPLVKTESPMQTMLFIKLI